MFTAEYSLTLPSYTYLRQEKLEQQMIGNIFAREAPNLAENGRDHYYLSPEDEKKL